MSIVIFLFIMNRREGNVYRRRGTLDERMQLMEFLVSENFQSWTYDEDFDCHSDANPELQNAGLFEEWVRSILQTQKGLQFLESRNGLYTLYMERLIGGLMKIVGPLVSGGRLDSQVLSDLLR
ncbi:hypothetical protein M5K25_016129 [Dendrobium thyrsiflorum]|uniref:Uncharacterized protein n=1 Tax=Dendrobium thyrsiflorum TaxID=117978 RepID=A0ABD0USI5_DENTH